MAIAIPPPLLDHPEYQIHYRWMSRRSPLPLLLGMLGKFQWGAVIVRGRSPDCRGR
ncbi:MAG: hypothetical protein HC832_08430, partial [Leptolyngbyaceae cyanobacterium RM1_405_57]|nr:hypothetical protein [Leptolyngbyaceae cyanobacterium RM1_405_57]